MVYMYMLCIHLPPLPRYIQLHRDTTVQGLTLAPSIQSGVLVWEDSPLVRAMRWGRVLVIDEVDKAPTGVCVCGGGVCVCDGVCVCV